jgi:hypothetical protein
LIFHLVFAAFEPVEGQFDLDEQDFLGHLFGFLEVLEAMYLVILVVLEAATADVVPQTILAEESADLKRMGGAEQTGAKWLLRVERLL